MAGTSGRDSTRFYSILDTAVYASESQDAAASTPKKSTAPALIPLPDGEGKDLTKTTCGKCHSTNIFASQGYTREQWSSIMDSMASKGMEATDDEAAQILDYLSASFPPKPSKASPPAPANPPAPK
jgi:mono/diheme cytochrome c family protein